MVQESLSGKVEKVGIATEEKTAAKKSNKAKFFEVDLRIHGPASLGYAAIEGIDPAPALVRLARVKAIHMIGLADSNSAAFIDRINAAGLHSGVTVIPGFSIRARLGHCDDVTLLCLFEVGSSTAKLQAILDTLEIPAHAAGRSDYVIQKEFSDVLEILENEGALVIPSRIDKTPSRLSVLKELVEIYGFRAFDLAYQDSAKLFSTRFPKTKFHLFNFSNAYALAQVGSRTSRMKLAEPTFQEVRKIADRILIPVTAPVIAGKQDAGKRGVVRA